MRTLFYGFWLICLSHLAVAEEIVEISSESGPLFLTVSILDAANNPIKTNIIKGRGYEWYSIPQGGVSVQLKGLGIPHPPVALFSGENTYIRVWVTDPATIDLTTQCDVKIRPGKKSPIPAGDTGWIYLGALEQPTDSSAWKSLFLAAADGIRLDRPGIPTLTKKMFDDMAAAGGNTFTVDFPLYLRSGIGADSQKILRAGQKVQIISLHSQPNKKDIYAEVKLL